jgi:hypothetical protein
MIAGRRGDARAGDGSSAAPLLGPAQIQIEIGRAQFPAGVEQEDLDQTCIRQARFAQGIYLDADTVAGFKAVADHPP